MKVRILPSRKNIETHNQFEPKLWVNAELRPEIQSRLLEIVEEVFGFFNLSSDLIEDVRFTGSLANYNYTRYSDLDLHIVVDFDKISDDTDLVKGFFDSKRTVWNQKHTIMIKGYEVEIYVENLNEKHISSGIYSVKDEQWIVRPSSERPKVDFLAVDKKTEQSMKDIDKAIEVGDLDNLGRMKEKIKKLRSCGLEKAGPHSIENLTFKALRRNGYIKKLHDTYTKEYDKNYSLPEGIKKT